jgi:Leucine-rich repeat (LRR) protein
MNISNDISVNREKSVPYLFHKNCSDDVKEYALSFLCFQDISTISKSYKEMGKRVIRNELKLLITIPENKKIIDGIVEKTLILKVEKHIEESKWEYNSEKNGKYSIDCELKDWQVIFKRIWKGFKKYNYQCFNDKNCSHYEKLCTERYDMQIISHKEILGNCKIIFLRNYNIVYNRIIKKLSKYEVLYNTDVGNCSIIEKYFDDNIEKIIEIKSFAQSNNAIMLRMPPIIKRLKKLDDLYIRNCALMKFPAFIGEFKFLKRLNLEYNRIKEIDLSIGNLKNLKWCSLKGNYISELPDSMENLTKLEFINISENSFEKIPKVLMKLKDVYIMFEKNKLEGMEYGRIYGWSKSEKGDEVLMIKSHEIREKNVENEESRWKRGVNYLKTWWF